MQHVENPERFVIYTSIELFNCNDYFFATHRVTDRVTDRWMDTLQTLVSMHIKDYGLSYRHVLCFVPCTLNRATF